jgi:hypothetical protein
MGRALTLRRGTMKTHMKLMVFAVICLSTGMAHAEGVHKGDPNLAAGSSAASDNLGGTVGVKDSKDREDSQLALMEFDQASVQKTAFNANSTSGFGSGNVKKIMPVGIINGYAVPRSEKANIQK